MARRPRGRVQVDDPLRRLPEQRVRPMAPDVFVGAPSVSGAGAGFRDLADALSGFAGSVGGLQKVFEARRKQEQENAEMEWRRLPREERERRFQAGIGPNGEPIRDNPAISKAQGIDYATKTLDEFQAHLDAGQFDMTGDLNVDEELFKFTEPLDRSFAANPFLQQGFREEVIKRREALMKKQTDMRLEALTKRTKEGVQTMLRTTFSRATEAGLDSDAKLKEINNIRNQMTKGPLAVGLPPQEIDNMAFALADEVAETDPALARKLLTEPRVGPDGETVGPLGYKGDNLEATERIMKRVVAQEKKNVEAAVEEKVTDAYLQRGLKGENIADITDFVDKHQDDTELKISKEQIKKAVFEKWKVRSAEIASRTNEPKEKSNAREIEELSRMGLTNPDWEALFKAFPSTLTEQNIQDPDKQAELLEIFQLYKQGRAGPKFFLDAHLDKNSRDLLDLAWVAETRLGQTSDQALMSALRATEMDDSDESLGSLNRAISKKIDGDYGPASTYAKLLRETARAYAKLGGMGADEAIEAAEARLSESGAEVNGSYVEIPRDPKTGKPIALPGDFDTLAEQTIERWFAKYGNPSEYKPSDLTLRGSPNGLFEIVDKLGNPVLGVNLEGGSYASPVLKMSDFLETKRKNEETVLKGYVTDQNIEQIVNNEGYMAGVYKYLEDLKTNDPSLGDSIKAHATAMSKLLKKGFRAVSPGKTPVFSRETYRLPNETK